MTNPKYSILYVDDEKNNLLIFKDTFRRNYNIFTATSAKEGAEILKNQEIDIILSDQRMPDISGVDFFKQTLKDYPNINRILITGYTDFKAIKSAINDAKIYQYVQKPWREDDLNATIQEALKIYELEKENAELLENLKIANEKLQEEKLKAEESNRLKSVFLSNLSHEIRTPLNGILGFSEFLKADNLDTTNKKKFIDIIIRSGRRLLKTIEDIVEISRFETNQIKVRNAEFDIHKFFQDIYSIWNEDAKEKNIKLFLENKISLTNKTLVADETKLQKIIGNIVENAIRYTEEGSVTIKCSIIKNNLFVEIKDTGIGISPKMHDEIFVRFRQEDEKNSREYDGLGLGLSIVKENVEILGGKINVESAKGVGSTFSFEIPIKTDF